MTQKTPSFSVFPPLLLVAAVLLVIFFAPPLGFGPAGDQLVPLIVLGLLGVLFWPSVKEHIGRLGKSREAGTAMSLVRERYARGEISREDYLRMMDDLARETM